RSLRCRSTVSLKHMSRVPAIRKAGGYPLATSPSRGVAGGSPRFLGAALRPPELRPPDGGCRAVDNAGSSPLRVFRTSPGFDPPAQLFSPTAPGKGSFCSGSHMTVAWASLKPLEAPNMQMFFGL